jgi:plastocyanin
MSKTLWVGIGLFAATILFVMIAIGRAGTSGRKPSVSTPSPTSLSSPTPTTEGAKEIQVIGSEYSYEPSSIGLNEGDKARLTFRNVGRLPHNLVIDKLGLATKTIGQGQSDTIEFVATSSGTFEFYCSVGNHRSLGMEGSLEVK